MVTTIAVLAGALLIVTGTAGVFGPWVGCIVAGLLLIVWAWLDYLGSDEAPDGAEGA